MVVNGIEFDEAQLTQFCRRHGVRKLSLFGSILGQRFRPDSDVDVLVEFEAGRRVSLFDLGGMAVELGALVGRTVDLRTPDDLSRYFRGEVMNRARPLYAA